MVHKIIKIKCFWMYEVKKQYVPEVKERRYAKIKIKT